MRPVDLAAVVPGYKEAVAQERLHRALAFAGVHWTLCNCPCVHLTPRHRVELQLAGNAFANSGDPMRGDVFQFLWRLNPRFSRVVRTPAAWWARLLVKREVKRAYVHAAVRHISDYLAAMLQDMPEATDGRESINPPENYVHWMAPEAAFYMRRFGMTLFEYSETPYLVLQQLHRAFRLTEEDGPQFINRSDLIVSQWIGQNRVRIHRDEN